MKGKIFSAILAGGTGTRMGAGDKPKQYLTLGDRPVIIHTLERFCEADFFEEILVLCPEEWREYTQKIIGEYISDARVTVLRGGETRNATLLCALDYIEKKYGLDNDSIILTHDAVRPFVTRRIIDDNVTFAIKYGACDTAVPATDTIVESSDGTVIDKIPERIRLYQGQTPQSFNIKKLADTVRSLTPDEEKTLTDCCKIFTIKGLPVYIVRGEASNIKITYKSDLKLAEALLDE